MSPSIVKYFNDLFRKKVRDHIDLVDRITKEKPTNPLIQEEYYTLDTMDTKCAGLLTHVSLMIAATIFLYADGAIVQHSVAKDFVLLEIFLYLLIALSLLYCLDMMALGHFTKDKDIASVVAEMFVKRLLIYRWALRLTAITTIAVLGTLASKRILS
jgi:hypothetical protein